MAWIGAIAYIFANYDKKELRKKVKYLEYLCEFCETKVYGGIFAISGGKTEPKFSRYIELKLK